MNIFDQFNLKGKVAVVTGASKGIGEAIALALGQAGAQVVISSRKQEAVDELAVSFQKQGIDAVGVACNTGKIEEIDHLIAATTAQYGGIDILVNNAATNPTFGPMADMEDWAFDKIIEINLKGPFELSRRAYRIMKQRGGGSVINISSIGGISPEPLLGIYSVSKAALISLTKVQAKEWGQDGIRANVICPGLIKTKFSEALWSNEQILKTMLRQLPIARVGTTDEIAGLALFLASDAGGYCTGSVFTADGGYTI
jgi:dehydrogenase/reductase SDR family member 4